jgi:hypothetical protein
MPAVVGEVHIAPQQVALVDRAGVEMVALQIHQIHQELLELQIQVAVAAEEVLVSQAFHEQAAQAALVLSFSDTQSLYPQ